MIIHNKKKVDNTYTVKRIILMNGKEKGMIIL